MRFLLGSNFWKMNTEESDKDYLEFIFPSSDDLFNCKMVSSQNKVVVDGEFCDVALKDVRTILKELKKGSLTMFEMMYSQPTDFLYSREMAIWEFIENNRDELFEELKYEFMKSVYGESVNRLKRLKGEFSGKQLAHTQKLLWLLILSDNYGNPFEVILGKTFTEKLLETRLNPTRELMADIERGLEQFKGRKFDTFKREDKPRLKELENIIKRNVFIL